MDVLHNLLNWIDHNRWKVLGVMMALIMMIGFTSCTPKMPSLIGSEREVSIEEFNLEILSVERELQDAITNYEADGNKLDARIDEHNAKVELGYAGYERKYEARRKFIELTGGVATSLIMGNPIDTAASITSLVTLLLIGGGAGAIADSKRKDKVIRNKKIT